MYYRLTRALIILIILIISVTTPAEAQSPLINYEETLEINVAADNKIASQSFSVTAGASEITNLEFTPGELVDAQGAPAVAADAITVTPKLVEQLKADTPLSVTVSIGSLPTPGNYTGRIAIAYDQQPDGTSEYITVNLSVLESPAPETTEPASGQAGGLDLVIATTPGGPAGELFFHILGDGTATAIPLYIRQTGDAEISGVHFYAYLADAEGGQLSDVSFNLTVGGTDVTETGITVPPGGSQVLATLNVANLTANGTFTGNIVAEHEGKLVEAAVLKGERYPWPALEIVGASDTGVVNLTSRITDFTAHLRIQSSNMTAVDDLKILVDSFTDPDGKQIPASWKVNGQVGGDVQQIALPGLESANLEIDAELPTAGDYTGVITLIYAGKSETTILKINRTRPAPSISILGLETALGTLPWNGQGNADLWMTLKETAGQTETLYLPQLTVLSLKGAEEYTFQAQYQGLEVRGEDNNLLPGSFAVQPGEVKRLQLNIRGLRKAGAYVGKLTLSAPDATAIEQDITILAKESPWVAGILVALSVLVSFGINLWLKSIRPRLERQQYAIRLLSDLEREARQVDDLSDGKKEVTEVVEELRRRLEDLYDNSDLGTDVKAGDMLNEIDKKISLLRRLVRAYRQVYALEPQKLVVRFAKDLRSIDNQMLTPTLASVQEADDKLKKLLADIDEALKEEMLQQLAAFEKNVKDQIAAAHEDATKHKLQKDILPKIASAREFVQKPELTAASLELKEARVEYARVMAEDLKASLDELPFGFDEDSWAAPKQAILQKAEAVRQETDGERAVQVYQEAYGLYLIKLVEKLLDSIREDLEQIGQKEERGQITSDQAKSLRDKINPLRTGLEATVVKIKNGDLATAREDYQAAKKIYVDEIQAELKKSGVKLGADWAESVSVALAAWGFIPERVSEKLADGLPDRRPRDRKNFARYISIGDFIVTAFALFAAILFGLLVLWKGNATWGGFDDHLVAILWGLGLHQVSNQGAKPVTEIIEGWRQSQSTGT